MLQLEMSGSEQKIQALRDRLQGEDDDLQRETDNRRRPGRAAKVSQSLVPLLRGEAAPDLLPSDEIESPHGLDYTTPAFESAINLIVILPHLVVLGLVAWAMLR